MNAKELRIGNLVYDTEGKVNTISLDALKYLVKYGDTNLCQAKPIPLTEEWLLKLGARKNNLPNGYWISVTNLKAELHFETFDNTDEIVTTLISQSCELILDRIKYVHTFQNLYFALTGEELTIK